MNNLYMYVYIKQNYIDFLTFFENSSYFVLWQWNFSADITALKSPFCIGEFEVPTSTWQKTNKQTKTDWKNWLKVGSYFIWSYFCMLSFPHLYSLNIMFKIKKFILIYCLIIEVMI